MYTVLDYARMAAYVAVAFSALVFVHELGHYLAARLVGIRVERFFIGFDIFGLAIKRTWGGCVYGIGALPLGGYVKMAGQSDDPRYEVITGAPDEFRSKPLWAQALVLGSGAGMNLIFGFVLLVLVFRLGIHLPEAAIGKIEPNMPAASAGFESGDKVVSIDDNPMRSFENLQTYVISNPGRWLEFVLRRPGVADPVRVQVHGIKRTDQRGKFSNIGLNPAQSRTLGRIVSPHKKLPKYPKNILLAGDEVLAVDDKPIPEPWCGDWIGRYLADIPGEKAGFRIRRAEQEREVKLPVWGLGEYEIGLRYHIKITGIAEDYPAARSGLKAGDVLVGYLAEGRKKHFTTYNALQKLTREHALQPFDLMLLRDGEKMTASIKPRYMGGDPRVQPPGTDTFLGIRVEDGPDGRGFVVSRVFPDGPAGELLQEGDLLVKAGEAEMFPADRDLADYVNEASNKPIRLLLADRAGDDPLTITPHMFQKHGNPRLGIVLEPRIAGIEPDSVAAGLNLQVGARLFPLGYENEAPFFLLADDLKTTCVSTSDPATEEMQVLSFATPAAVRADPVAHGVTGYIPAAFHVAEKLYQARSVGETLALAGRESLHMASQIFLMLHKLITTEFHPESLGGPIAIARFLSGASEASLTFFLRMVAFISINLAVLNLLPLPVLDGGHLLFTLVEWIKGSPTHPKVREYAQYVGLICLLALFLYVSFNDVKYTWFVGG